MFKHSQSFRHFVDLLRPLCNQSNRADDATKRSQRALEDLLDRKLLTYSVVAEYPNPLSDFRGRPSTIRVSVWIVFPRLHIT